VWFQAVAAQSRHAAVTCGGCGQVYALDLPVGGALAARARRLARLNDIDLPGAYSLLLGIMTVEELRELGESGSTPCRTAPVDDPGPHRYDRAFQPAIDEGLLTPRQAAERGKRDACAAIFASRHKLPGEVAYAVADNRVSLLAALRERAAQASPPGARVVRRVRVGRSVALVGVLAAVALLAVLSRRPSEVVAAPVAAPTAPRDTEVRLDEQGRIIQVRGPAPGDVLRAYCNAAAGTRRLEPLDTVATELKDGPAHLGLLRDPEQPSMTYAIVIREESETRRWSAGGGPEPLVARPAPRGAQQAVQRP
jgi:hypothetical protein